jgi:tRNA-2-methylthio-N6-dimethylallyladenosine synthase
VRQLVDQGCKEVTLIGQTVNSYMHESGDRRTRLSDLIAGMHDTPGLERIKFVTNYPKDMTDDLLDAVRELPKVVKYLHVPVQSGCDEVLKRMKRNYTASYYEDMLARCRERVPGVAVTSDFIVGFCGETEESFAKTVELVRRSRFKNSFIFKYSERPGTKAADRYPDDIPEDVKKRRNNDLLAVQNENSRADHRDQVGRVVDVLVEGPSRRDSANPGRQSGGVFQLTGRTMTDHIVVFDGTERLVGRTVRVAVRDSSPFTLYGDALTEEVIGVDAVDAVRHDVQPARPTRIGLPVV